MSGPWPWYVARASGLIAWLLLAAATLWGLAMATKILGRRPRANWMLDMHRWLGGTTLALTGIHVGALLGRPVHPLQPRERVGAVRVVVEPARGHVRRRQPLSPARGRAHLTRRAQLPHDIWRKIHYASFPLFVTATVHGLTAGTDSRVFVSLVCMFAVSGLVIFLTALRLMHVPPPNRSQPARTERRPLAPAPASHQSEWAVVQPTRTDRISTTG